MCLPVFVKFVLATQLVVKLPLHKAFASLGTEAVLLVVADNAFNQ